MAVKALMPDYPRPGKPKERLRIAKEFLKVGKNEIEKGRATNDPIRIREGSEKVFHALSEACAARIQKYGLHPPRSHNDTIRGLESANEKSLKETFINAFHNLHTDTYYGNLLDIQKIKREIKEVEDAIEYIEKRNRR